MKATKKHNKVVLELGTNDKLPNDNIEGIDWNALEAQSVIEGQAQLARFRAQIVEDIPIRMELRIGSAGDEIVNVADEFNVDLIVISTHGRTGLRRVFMGSVAEHVTRYAQCPVLTVRLKERDFVQSTIEVPVRKVAGKG